MCDPANQVGLILRCEAFAMASDIPRGLQSVEWLTAQGARGAFIRSASGLINPELTSALMHWAANTVEPLPEDPTSEPWQNAVSEYRRESLKAMDFDPARMVQYVSGRPCVVRRQQKTIHTWQSGSRCKIVVHS